MKTTEQIAHVRGKYVPPRIEHILSEAKDVICASIIAQTERYFGDERTWSSLFTSKNL